MRFSGKPDNGKRTRKLCFFFIFQTAFVIFQHLLYHGVSKYIAPISPSTLNIR